MGFPAKSGEQSAAIARMMSKTSIMSLLLLLPALHLVVVGAENDDGLNPRKSPACSLRDALMDPTYENRYGVEVVWQIPPNPKAVLFLGVGSNFEAIGYFDPGPKCEQCYGLPEARTIVLGALRRAYAVIVVQSIGYRYDVCDVSIEASQDLVVDTNIIKEWIREHSLDGLPFAAWGHSAGAFLASALTTTLSMQAIVSMCGPGVFEVELLATPITHPPTFFAYMPRDIGDPGSNFTLKQREDMAILTERGVNVTSIPLLPKPLSPLFFTERILCMSESMSRKIFEAYDAAGWLDSHGYLTMNPSTEDYESILLKANALPFCEASGELCLQEHVSEELHMAYAMHSLTSAADGVIFPWLDSTIMSSLEGSVLQHGAQLAATN